MTRSPAEFRFAVKAPRIITHFRRFHNVAEDVRSFYDLFTKGLGEKLGCVLFQLHPQMVYTGENLGRILSVLDPAYSNVVEFRHASWWCEPVVKALKQHNVTFCSISYPGLPDAVIRSAPVLYYRFHGVPKLYLSSYSNKKLMQIRESLQTTRGGHEIYAYFNNDIDVAAVYNARKLQESAGYGSPEI